MVTQVSMIFIFEFWKILRKQCADNMICFIVSKHLEVLQAMKVIPQELCTSSLLPSLLIEKKIIKDPADDSYF